MRSLSDTLQRLARARSMAAPVAATRPGQDRLRDLEGFGSNPGNLRARIHVPSALAPRPALVVVLHGCTQTAAGYDAGSGWSRLADRHGFMVLFPEQQRANNPNLCFNWFNPEDIGRDRGEALSIRQMIAVAVRDHGIGPARIFVTGLSAGGAMTSVMLATYPELFAGGAIIAGLPHGSASTVAQALDRMRGHGQADATALTRAVRDASGHDGPWPRVSIWHGSADATVHPDNAAAIVAQWQGIHGLTHAAAETDLVDGQHRRTWRDAAGRAVIEDYSIAGMGHGTPLDPRGSGGAETAGAHMLDMGISSTSHIATFWGLTDAVVAPRKPLPVPAVATAPASIDSAAAGAARESARPAAPAAGPARVIEDALRAAGLMR